LEQLAFLSKIAVILLSCYYSIHFSACVYLFLISFRRTRISIAWSVCMSVVCLSPSSTLLKLFYGFRRHLAGTLAGSNDTLCSTGSLTLQGKARFGGGSQNPQP